MLPERGEVASEMAVRITSHAIGSLRGMPDQEASDRMRRAIRAASDAIFERPVSEDGKRGTPGHQGLIRILS